MDGVLVSKHLRSMDSDEHVFIDLEEYVLIERAIETARDYPTRAELEERFGDRLSKSKIDAIVDYLKSVGKIYETKDKRLMWSHHPLILTSMVLIKA